MSLRRICKWLFLSALLAGCASPLVSNSIARMGGPGNSPAVQPAKDGPAIWLTLPTRGVKFSMTQLDHDGDVTIWAAKDSSQTTLRNGMLIATRGFGRDLMSANVPTVATLLSGKAHTRSYYDLDGTDTMIRHDFTCTTTQSNADAKPFARHLIERCDSEIGTISNEFWLDSAARLQKSRQWISQGVGYAAIEPNNG